MVFLLFVISGCNQSEKTIKIGVVGTMTGTQSDLSVSGRRGIEIAVDEINEAGGINEHKVELVVKDDENDPIRAAEIVQEFVDEDISYVIGHYTSGMMLAAYSEVLEHDVLYLGPTISTDRLSEIDDNFIRFVASTREQAQIINEIAANDGHKNFAVIFDAKNIGFYEALYANFREILEYNGGNILWDYGYETLDQGVMNELVDNCKTVNSELDAVFVISGANDLAQIAQTFGKKDVECRLYGTPWAHTNDLIRVGGEYAEGIRVVSGIDYDLDLPKFTWFQKEYERRFGQAMTFSSIYSYETVYALADALTRNKDLKNIHITKAEMISRVYEGLQGEFSIDEYGDNSRAYMMDEVSNNEYKRID